MSERVVILCRLWAEMPRAERKAMRAEKEHCAFCARELAITPSSLKLLRRRPDIDVACNACGLARRAPSFEIGSAPEASEAFRRELPPLDV